MNYDLGRGVSPITVHRTLWVGTSVGETIQPYREIKKIRPQDPCTKSYMRIDLRC